MQQQRYDTPYENPRFDNARFDVSPPYYNHPQATVNYHLEAGYVSESNPNPNEQNLRFIQPGPAYYNQNPGYRDSNIKYNDLSSRFAKLRMLDSTKLLEKSKSAVDVSSRLLDTNKMFESTTKMLESPQDAGDRDTNNDSGYSTKVYGSSKGNSPSFSGQTDGDCVVSSSLV